MEAFAHCLQNGFLAGPELEEGVASFMTGRCAKRGLFGRCEEFARNGFKVAIRIDAFHINAHFPSARDRNEREFARMR